MVELGPDAEPKIERRPLINLDRTPLLPKMNETHHWSPDHITWMATLILCSKSRDTYIGIQ